MIFYPISRPFLLQVLLGQHAGLPAPHHPWPHPRRRLLRPPRRDRIPPERRHPQVPHRKLQTDSFSRFRLQTELRRLSLRLVRHRDGLCFGRIHSPPVSVQLFPGILGCRFAHNARTVKELGRSIKIRITSPLKINFFF